MDCKIPKYGTKKKKSLAMRLTKSSNTKGDQGRKALITGQLHQSSIFCLTKVQQLARGKEQHNYQTM